MENGIRGAPTAVRPPPASSLDSDLFLERASDFPLAGEVSQAGFSALDQDISFLLRFGFGYPELLDAQKRATNLGLSASEVLIGRGVISEIDYYCCVSFELGLHYVHETPSGGPPFFELQDGQALLRMARMVTSPETPADETSNYKPRSFYIAPDCRRLEGLRRLLADSPDLAQRVKVASLSSNRASLIKRNEPAMLAAAIGKLATQHPQFSARQVVTVSQAVTLLLVLQGLALLSLAATGLVPLLLHLVSSLFYLGCIGLRLYALFHFEREKRFPSDIASAINRNCDSELPKYSVLVALFHEAGQIEDLVDGLCKFDWPCEKLEIMLVCEADDAETITAVREKLSRTRATQITMVTVPVAQPRTKPKALNYALPLCTGELLVIYDAEDRPSPLQLREAHAAFRDGPDNLACLQAPLVVLNNRENLLAGLFAVEYSSLFDGLLPALAKARAPFPLGGTSNHFKREVLTAIGGWDPYNVTEDADLGIRLARAGCLIDTLKRPTFEEGPADLNVWLKQRTRWFKGWYQTWLVHNRHPMALWRDLGFRGWLVFHLMITGMAVSALVHPLLVYFILVHVIAIANSSFWAVASSSLFLLDVATILLGYGTFAALAWDTLPMRNLTHLRRRLWAVPLYWMLLSAAAWRALWHLVRRPHEWEKTPHRLRLLRKSS